MMRNASREHPLRTLLNIVLVLEGAGALGVQMLAIRQAAPWTGQSIVVVSIVVSTFLGALAVGYAWGGRYRGENALESAGWTLLAGAAVAAIIAGRQGTAVVMELASASGAGTIASAAIYAGAMVLPCAACLGRAVVLVSTCYPAQSSGARTGWTFAWSTTGNVAGGLLVPLVVMHHFGTEVSVALAATCLALAGALCVQRQSAALLGIAIAAGSASLAGFEAARGALSTPYGHYEITRHNESTGDKEAGREYRILWADGAAASRHDDAGRAWRYIERIEDHVWPRGTNRTRIRKIAVLGAAGMTVGDGRDNHDRITYVDIEPKTRHLAQVLRNGEVEGKRLRIDDARVWLRGEDPKSWDVIVVDVYRGRWLPVHVMTLEWMHEVRQRLRVGGTMVLNTIVSEPPGRYGRRVDRTVRAVFADCEIEHVQEANVTRALNRLYMCRKWPGDDDQGVYRDSLSSAQRDATWTRSRRGTLR